MTSKKQLVRFVISGLTAAGVYFLVSYGLHSMEWPPFSASLAAYVCAFGVGYALQRGWTFEARHRHGRALPRYLLVQVACALGTSLAAPVLVGNFALTPLAVSLVLTVLASGASYLASSLWVFAPAKVEPPE
jgi:putative flippase GtrA